MVSYGAFSCLFRVNFSESNSSHIPFHRLILSIVAWRISCQSGSDRLNASNGLLDVL